jgi:hypothetical protein
MLFSATLDHAVDVLVRRFLHHPAEHAVDPPAAPAHIVHHLLTVAPADRTAVVAALAADGNRSLIFTRTKHGARKLARQLATAHIPAAELHGNLTQPARERNLARFASGAVRVMVATDIAARGIHVDGIGLVIHADPPADRKAYLHRSGRTGRAGASGVTVTLQTPAQANDVRALAPQRPPIVLQRWSVKRVALAAGVLAIAAVSGFSDVRAFSPADDPGAYAPRCGTGHSMILSAQAVPSAAKLPCLAALPSGWSIGGADITSGTVIFWLNSDRAGPGAITVTLTARCDISGAQQIPSDQPGTRRFERPLSLLPRFSGLRFYTFPGGCATYRFSFAPGASPVLAIATGSALSFQPRPALVDFVRRNEGIALCGRGARCPG